MDPCPYLFKYSFNVLKKKTKVLDILNTAKNVVLKLIQSSPPEIWIRIRFLEINGSPSLIQSVLYCIYSNLKIRFRKA